MDLVVYDDEERRYVPWLVTVAAVVLTGALAAGLTFLFTRSGDTEQLGGVSAPQAATASSPPEATAPPATPDPPPAPTPSVAAPSAPAPSAAAVPSAAPSAAPAAGASAACEDALGQADTALQRSAALEQALAEQTRVMDELLAKRLTTDQALDRSLPVLTRGASDREQFAEELAAYERARDACSD